MEGLTMIRSKTKTETYNIEVLSNHSDDLTPSPEILPKVTGIISHEVLRDMMHSFENMTHELRGKLHITRTLYFWCIYCGAYIGCREVEYIAQKFRFPSEESQITMDSEIETHRCGTCREVSEYHFEPVLHVMY
jgi:hypothetical protein